MSSRIADTINMKVFPKGQIVIPVSLRKKYNIDIGDKIEVTPTRDGIFLRPSPKSKKRESLTDNLFGVFRDYAEKALGVDKNEILKATENGFSEGWEK